MDSAANVYVADTYNQTIRKVTPAGSVSTLAGSVGSTGGADGSGSAALFNYPFGVAADGAGNIYVADANNHTIRQVTPLGVVTTLGGSAGSSGTNDGVGSAARFNNPYGVAVDLAGNLYVADTSNNRISKGTPMAATTITAQPQGGSFQCGSPVNLTVASVGLEPFAYQWYLGGSPVAGATGSSYSFTLTPATVGNYTVVVTNSYGAVTSVVATVSDPAPTIVCSPQNQTNLAGTTVSFTVSASACSTITYQWQKNGVALSDGGNVSRLGHDQSRPLQCRRQRCGWLRGGRQQRGRQHHQRRGHLDRHSSTGDYHTTRVSKCALRRPGHLECGGHGRGLELPVVPEWQPHLRRDHQHAKPYGVLR